MRFDNLAVGTSYTVVLGYDVTHSGAHAIDYLGSWNTLNISNRTTNTVATRAGINPCSGVAGCVLGSPSSTAPITLDNIAVTNQTNPYTSGSIYQPSNQVFTIWGATGLTFAYESIDGNVATDSQVERRIRVTFTPTVSNPVLAWSGHIAYGGDWGAGNSAGGISGSPYHMRFIGLCVTTTPPAPVGGCTTGGNQDRSLSADAVIISGIVNITKVVNTVGGGTSANTAFPFTASTTFGDTSFSLIDDDAGPGFDTVQSQAITTFGVGNEIVVNEENSFGWTLSDITCTTNIASSASTVIRVQPAANAGTATITMNPGGIATCVFTNTQSTITAAPASVTGQVLTASGVPLRGINITLIDATTGVIRTTTTSSFGFYSFDNLPVDDFYQMMVTSKKYRFQNPVVTFTLTEDLAGVNFIGTN
jgi:hypothetical protein